MIGTEIKEHQPFYHYAHIRYIGDSETEGIFLDEVCVQEKADGSNFQFSIYKGELVFGSRNIFLGPDPQNDWKKPADFIKQLREKNPGTINPELVYYCEYMIHHTLSYNHEITPTVIGFDVMDKNTEKFFSADAAKKEFEKIGITFAPIIFRKKGEHVKIEELKLLVETNKSAFGDVIVEGVVIKNVSRLNKFGRPLYGKVVRDSFKEANKLAFTALKELRDGERKIIEEFCTEARIKKSIHRLTIEEGKELSMKIMPELYRLVADDILTECITEISRKYESIYFKEFTNLVAASCAKVLKKYLMEQST